MLSKIKLPEIVWKRGSVPLDGENGQYLVLSDDRDFSENDYVVADFWDGFLDTHGYIPEEEIIAHAYLPAQRP